MISNARLQNFRSYADESFEFEEGVNIIVGPNASGKTNLLEAILVLVSGGSYRARDAELIRFGAPWARLDGAFDKHQRVVKIVSQGQSLQGLSLGRAGKTHELDTKVYKRLNLERTVPAVVFEPNHLQLVNRGPGQRRDYFDDILSKTTPGFKSLSSSYRRALTQRNALLKQNPARAQKQLFAWNVRLSQLGSQLVEERLRLLEGINESISRVYSKIAGKKTSVRLDYDTPLLQGQSLQGLSLQHYSSRLLSRLESSAPTDFARGFTGFGPHREDIIIYLNDQVAAATASRGEIRSLLLALKIYELKLLEKSRDQKPLFLLDDVFSELDGARRRHLVEHLKNYQTIVTTTDAEAVVEYFSKNSKIIAL